MKWLAVLPMLWVLCAQAFFFSSTAPEIELTDSLLLQSQDSWDSLIPMGAYDFVPDNLSDTLFYSDTFQAQIEAAGQMLNAQINGSVIAMGGFMVPLEVSGEEVTVFLLVPEAGQCIHIPPPPVNQTVLVDVSANPVALRSLYDPIWVEGPIETYVTSTELAEVGYRMILPEVKTLIIEGYDPGAVPRHEGD